MSSSHCGLTVLQFYSCVLGRHRDIRYIHNGVLCSLAGVVGFLQTALVAPYSLVFVYLTIKPPASETPRKDPTLDNLPTSDTRIFQFVIDNLPYVKLLVQLVGTDGAILYREKTKAGREILTTNTHRNCIHRRTHSPSRHDYRSLNEHRGSHLHPPPRSRIGRSPRECRRQCIPRLPRRRK